MKKLSIVTMLFVVFVALATYASAVNLDVTSLRINGDDISEADYATARSNSHVFERGEDLDLRLCVRALSEVKDAQIEADIVGYRYSNYEENKVSDASPTFDLDQNDSKCYTLNVQIPTKADTDYYKLRIRVADRDGTSFENIYQLRVDGISRESAVEVKDFSLTPEDVVAGRAFTGMVKVHNYGDDDLDDLKVTVSVSELGIKATEFMDTLDADESKSFEQLLLRVPECAKPGLYDVEMKVEFDEFEETVATSQIRVTASDTCPLYAQKSGSGTTITVPNAQEVAQGSSVVYPVVIANSGNSAKAYTVSVSGASGWATARVDPSSVVVVPAGQSKTAYVYVSANSNADLGDKVLTVTVESSDESKQIPVTAKITGAAASWAGLRSVLEVGLIVLVVILIVLGLVIAFNKMKDGKDEPEKYY